MYFPSSSDSFFLLTFFFAWNSIVMHLTFLYVYEASLVVCRNNHIQQFIESPVVCRVWQSKVLVSFFVSPLSFCLVQCNSAFGMNTSSLPAWTQILNIPHMYPRLFSKCPCPEQPNSDWKHWDMGRNQRSSPFLCYCNWTVHASTLAGYIHVHPTSSSVGSKIATHSSPNVNWNYAINKYVGLEIVQTSLFGLAFPVVSNHTPPWCVLSKRLKSNVQETSLNKEHQISHLFSLQNLQVL